MPMVDGGGDGGTDGGNTGPTITVCTQLPPNASGEVCEATPGTGGTLYAGDILLPGEILIGGQVLLDEAGIIACVGCDCAASAQSSVARVTCPDGAISPGLINTHEHLSFQGLPYQRTAERYEHRHDWRRGARGHTRIASPSGNGPSQQWAEVRMAISGVTSMNGSGAQNGFVRNLDRSAMEGLGQPAVEYDTFPLGDSDGTVRATGCDYSAERTTATSVASQEAYTPHVSEGISTFARNEYLCIREGEYDLISDRTALIHGIGLLPGDISELAAEGATLVWSPRSNVTLYGETARVPEYHRLGVRVALGTDWIYTGSMNLLRELRCADELNANYFGGYLSDDDLFRMVTVNAAVATGTDDVLGTLAVGKVGDLAIYDARVHANYRAVIDAEPQDVVLVARSGVPLFGAPALVSALAPQDQCDSLDVCGSARSVCVNREFGQALAALSSANSAQYPLFFCGTPDNEPSCVPERTEARAQVEGSNNYSGIASADDRDGDGIANATDNCPSVFNPIRPLDMGAQSDVDQDQVGDVCDPCPLDATSSNCSSAMVGDLDRDNVPDEADNCPSLANTDQLDTDGDAVGDVCDACPMAANPGGAPCPSTIYAVKSGAAAVGSRVRLSGVVTALATNGFFLQVPEGAGNQGADNSGIFVFTGAAPTVPAGNLVELDATVATFADTIQLGTIMVRSMSAGVIPAPVAVTADEIRTGGTRAMGLQDVLVRITNASVINAAPTPGTGDVAPTFEFTVENTLRVDDLLFRIDPFVVEGEAFTSITGILALRRGETKLNPRAATDFAVGTARLLSIEPALSYVRMGDAAGMTFPIAAEVRLARSVGTDTVIALTAPGGLVSVMDVTIPAGQVRAPISALALMASATPTNVIATLGQTTVMSSVRVLGATEGPTTLSFDVAAAELAVERAQTFTVTLDLPALAGGASIALADDVGGLFTTPLVIPAGQLSATFSYTARATPGTGTLTAMGLSGASDSLALTITNTPGTLVINEVDYDQPSTDTAEFVELHNPGSSAFDLNGIVVVLVNGTNGMEYGRATLSGTLPAGGYLVIGIAGQTLAVPGGVNRIDFSGTSSIQNDNEAVLILRASGELIDAYSWEGGVTMTTIGGMSYMPIEGTASTLADVGAGSICRIPNGQDTNNNGMDFSRATSVTVGAANIPNM